MAVDRAEIAAAFDEHVARIASLIPGAHVELSGSALVESFAAEDVDIVVLTGDVTAAAAKLAATYPSLYPDHWSSEWAAFRVPGPPQVDVIVTQPGSWGDAHHHLAWELIRARPDLQDEYRELKAEQSEYAERKAAFFDRVVALLPS